MNRTPWYPIFVDPVRVGTYEVKARTGGRDARIVRLQWDGECWRFPSAFEPLGWEFATRPGDEWRGLTGPAR